MARIVRAQAFQLKNMEFVQYAKALAVHTSEYCKTYITQLYRYNNSWSYVQHTCGRICRSVLKLYRIGVRIPKASLGTLASDGYRYMDSHPWLFGSL
jgi:oligopeptide transport system permease protein